MTLTTTLSNYLHNSRNEKFSFNHILDVSPLAGGDINEVFKVETDQGNLVAKCNNSARFPGMFEAESKGLELLQKGGFKTPEVLTLGEEEGFSFLILEYLKSENATPAFWESFGNQLAQLHQNTQDTFGLDHNNYMGSLVQQNAHCSDWAEFFITQRLEPQLKLAYDEGYFKGLGQRWSSFMNKLESLVPKEKPALVHGDLWSGNFICGENQTPVLIDPAAHYGHREADISMMHLFGGFDPSLFETYNEQFALESGWRQRVDIHNLYPLLVHVNLFGGSYAQQVSSILKRFTD